MSRRKNLFSRFFIPQDEQEERAVELQFGKLLQYSTLYINLDKDHFFSSVLWLHVVVIPHVYFILLFTYSLYLLFPNLSDMVRILQVHLLAVQSVSVLYTSFVARGLIGRLWKKYVFDSVKHYDLKDPKTMDYMEKADKLRKLVRTAVSLSFNALILVFFLVGPVTYLFGSGDKEEERVEGIDYGTPLPMYNPFLEITSYGSWVQMAVMAQSSLVLYYVLLGGVCLYLYSLINLGLQLLIMRHQIDSLDALAEKEFFKRYRRRPLREVDLNTLCDCYVACLKNIVQLQSLTWKCFNETNDVIQYAMLVMVTSGGIDIAMAAALLFIDGVEAGVLVLAIGLAFVELVIFACLTFTADWITELNDEICSALYMTEWPDYDPKVKMTILTTMTFNQKPKFLVAGKLYVINREMYSNILQTAWTFVNLLIAAKRT